MRGALNIALTTLFFAIGTADARAQAASVAGVAPAAKISAVAVGNPSIGATSEIYRVRGDASQIEHVEGLPIGTRGGLVAKREKSAARAEGTDGGHVTVAFAFD